MTVLHPQRSEGLARADRAVGNPAVYGRYRWSLLLDLGQRRTPVRRALLGLPAAAVVFVWGGGGEWGLAGVAEGGRRDVLCPSQSDEERV